MELKIENPIGKCLAMIGGVGIMIYREHPANHLIVHPLEACELLNRADWQSADAKNSEGRRNYFANPFRASDNIHHLVATNKIAIDTTDIVFNNDERKR